MVLVLYVSVLMLDFDVLVMILTFDVLVLLVVVGLLVLVLVLLLLQTLNATVYQGVGEGRGGYLAHGQDRTPLGTCVVEQLLT